MFKNISKLINSHAIGQLFNLGEKTAAWRKVRELKAGMKIAITPTSLRGGTPTWQSIQIDSRSPREYLPANATHQALQAGARDDTVEWDEIVSIKKLPAERVWDIEVEGTHNFVGNGIVAHNTSGILLRAGSASLQLSSSATSTTADIQLAAADRIDLFAGSLSLQTSSTSAGDLKIISKGSLILDTSSSLGGSAPIIMNGNVGIGTTGPSRTLDVVGNIRTSTGIQVRNGTSTTGEYSISMGGSPYPLRIAGADDSGTHRSIQFGYYTSDDIAGTWNPKVSIDSYNGNVGIGTTSPASKLNVVTDDATTNAVTDVVTVDHTTSGTGANNIGAGLVFRAEDSGGTAQNTGRVAGIITSNDSYNRDNVQTALTFGTRGVTYVSDAGTFATTSQAQLPQIKEAHGAVTANIGGTQYIYVTGGYNGSTYVSTVYKSTIDASGNTGAFSTTSQAQLPQTNGYHNTVTTSVGGTQYIYVIGGNANGVGAISTVYKSTIDASGNTGAFSTTSQAQLLQTIYGLNAVTASIGGTQYIYVTGGYNGSGYISTVYKSTIDASGNTGAFSTTSQAQLLQTNGFHNTVTASIGGTQYIYVVGGFNGSYFSTVYKATIDASGNIGAFSTTSQAQLPQLGHARSTVIANIGGTQYMYVTGGTSSGTPLSTVYKATIDTSGNIGAFSTTSQAQLPQVDWIHTTVTTSISGTQYMYVIGGENGTSISTVYKSTIGPDSGSSTLTERMRLDYSGNLGIGTTGPGGKLHVIGTAGNDTGTWSNLGASDIRLKKDITVIDSALEKLSQLKGVTYNWINPQDHGDRSNVQMGFIAQNIEQYFPEWTIEFDPWGDDRSLVPEGDKIKSYGLGPEFNALVVESVKELASDLTLSTSQTESKVASLTDRITQLEDLVAIMASGQSTQEKQDISGITLEADGFNLSGSYLNSEVNLGGGLVSPLASTKLTLDVSTDTVQVLGSATIGGSLTVGLLTINDMDASINSIGESLKIQNQALADIEFLGGKIVMTKTGDVEIKGNLTVAGDVIVGGTVAGTKIEILEDPVSLTSPTSPTFASIGEVTIKTGEKSVTIYSTAVGLNSKVFVTADQPAAIGAKVTGAGQFTIELAEPEAMDLKVNWWVVN